ncbi:replication protein A 70 kDa DNA-binding subunit B [Tanacetum coccineum]
MKMPTSPDTKLTKDEEGESVDSMKYRAMKPNEKPTPIKDINPMVLNMSIKGRVVSIWHGHKLNQAYDLYSLELVLQDEEVYNKKDWMFRFEPLLQYGICYVLSNFGVTENGGKLPLLPHAWKLYFTRIQMLRESTRLMAIFLALKMNHSHESLTPMKNIKRMMQLVYVIGTVVGIGDIVAVDSIGSIKIRRTVVTEDEQ